MYAVSELSDIVYKYDGKDMVPVFRVSLPKLCPTESILQEYKETDFFTLRNVLHKKGYGLGLTGIASIGSNLVLSIPESQVIVTDGNEGIVVSSIVYDKDTDIYSLSFFTPGISEDNIGCIEAFSLLETKGHIMKGNNPQLKKLIETLTT